MSDLADGTSSPATLHESQAMIEAPASPMATPDSTPADALFATVRSVIQGMLTAPMKEADIAAALGVSPAQAKVWLQRLVDEGLLCKLNKPARYVVAPLRMAKPT